MGKSACPIRHSVYKPFDAGNVMNTFGRLNLRAMTPIDAGSVCKESLLRLVMEIHECKANGNVDCARKTSESARNYLEKAIRMDSDAFASSKCHELSSIAGME